MKSFKELPLLGIMRGIDEKAIAPLMEGLAEAGLKAVEITMNTRGAAHLIEKAKKASEGAVSVGAGTVLSKKDLDAALKAGAEFIVMPAMVPEVMEACVKEGVPVFPGAFTPQEVLNAWSAGATMVKVFPAGMLGPKYIKELKGPFDKVKLMAVGGVHVDNIGEYFEAGAEAVAFGASVFKKEWLTAGDYTSIKMLVGEYVNAVKAAMED